MHGEFIEVAPFRLREGVPEARLLEASEAIQREFLARQPGFLRRDLARGADGRWADVVYWADEASVHEAMGRAGEHPACRAYFACMAGVDGGDDPGATLMLLRRLRSYQA